MKIFSPDVIMKKINKIIRLIEFRKCKDNINHDKEIDNAAKNHVHIMIHYQQFIIDNLKIMNNIRFKKSLQYFFNEQHNKKYLFFMGKIDNVIILLKTLLNNIKKNSNSNDNGILVYEINRNIVSIVMGMPIYNKIKYKKYDEYLELFSEINISTQNLVTLHFKNIYDSDSIKNIISIIENIIEFGKKISNKNITFRDSDHYIYYKENKQIIKIYFYYNKYLYFDVMTRLDEERDKLVFSKYFGKFDENHINKLLKDNVDINKKDHTSFCNTILHWLVANSDVDYAIRLLKNGHRFSPKLNLSLPDMYGNTPLMLAIQKGYNRCGFTEKNGKIYEHSIIMGEFIDKYLSMCHTEDLLIKNEKNDTAFTIALKLYDFDTINKIKKNHYELHLRFFRDKKIINIMNTHYKKFSNNRNDEYNSDSDSNDGNDNELNDKYFNILSEKLSNHNERKEIERKKVNRNKILKLYLTAKTQ